ncbi:hypothetical protein ABZ401_28185 [Streptomyces sp. NPDC005892]|uniref:hypothetical protein n=1 Tax=Streptomyces sp. NPDC005892 TaxID=3155593 RepID=UPI0033CBFCCD
MVESATEAEKEFALCVRDLFARLKERGMGHREIAEELGAGMKAPTLSRMGRAGMVPTPQQLKKLLLLVEVKVDSPLPAEVHQRVHATHAAALRTKNPQLYELMMAEEQARFWQLQWEEFEARGALTERELAQSRTTQTKLATRLRQSQAEIEKVKSDARDRVQVSEAEHAAAMEAARHRLSELVAVKDELEESADLLRARIERLETALREVQTERAEAREALVLANERANEAELAAVVDQREREKLGEEISVLKELLEQVRTERDDLQREHASRAADADVVAAAEAAVRRAEQRLSQKEPTHAGAGSVDESIARVDAQPSRSEVHLEAVRVGGAGSPDEIVATVQDLLAEGDLDAVEPLLSVVAGRGGEAVLTVMGALGEAGLYRQREQLLRACARLPAGDVVAVVRALQAGDAVSEVGWLLDESAQAPAEDLTRLVSSLLERGLKAVAARLLDAAVPRRPPSEVAELIHVLERNNCAAEAERLAQGSVTRRPARDIVALLPRLPDASLEAAVVALAARPYRALVAVLALLSTSGEAALTATVTDRVATKPIADVADVLAALRAPGGAGDWSWLLDSFLQQRPGDAVELAEVLVGRERETLRQELIARVGARGTAEQIIRMARYTRALALDEASLLEAVVQRPPEEVWSLLVTFAGGMPDLAADALTRCIHDRPVRAAAEVVDRLLESGLASLHEPLTELVATACRNLEHAVEMARTLRAGPWGEEASTILGIAGRTVLSPADFASVVGGGLAVQDLVPLLRGACEREAVECADLIRALDQSGATGYAQLMVEYLPQTPLAFVELSDALTGAGLDDYVLALHQRAVRTSSPGTLVEIFGHCSSAKAARLSEVTAGYDASFVAGLVAELGAQGLGHDVLQVLRVAGSGSAARTLELADLLAAAGRPRQSSWLTHQARLLRSGSRPCLPPAEHLDEAADAAEQLFDDSLLADSYEVLDRAVVELDVTATTLLSALAPDVLTGYCGYLTTSGRDTAAADKVLPATADELIAYLNELTTEADPARGYLIQHTVSRVQPSDSAALFSALQGVATAEELEAAYRAAAQGGDAADIVRSARAVMPHDANRAFQILQTALHRNVEVRSAEALLEGAMQLGFVTTREQAASFMSRALPDSMIDALLAAHYPPVAAPAPTRQGATDGVCPTADEGSHPEASPDEQDRAAGYRRQHPGDIELTYFDGAAWTHDRLPADPGAAKLVLEHHLEEAQKATEPSAKAYLYQRLAAGHSVFAYAGADVAQARSARENFAYWLGRSGDWEEARRIHAELVSAQVQRLGALSEVTLRCRYNFANSTGMAGHPTEAAGLFEKLLVDYQRVQGANHKNSILALRAYAVWSGMAGDAVKAVRLLEQAINRLLHGQNPNDAAEQENILRVRALHAQWTGKAGDSKQAAWLYDQLTTYSSHLLGPDHDVTLQARIGHATWTGKAGDARHAANLYRRIVDTCVSCKGPHDETTLRAHRNYAHWLEAAGDHELAAHVLEKIAVDARKDAGAADASSPNPSQPDERIYPVDQPPL